jgi:mono/diheme cytochrome c family protein
MLQLNKAVCTAILASAAVWCSLGAAVAADPSNGKRLAERWCVSCHLVEPGQRSATTQAPPFSEVAKRPGFDAAKLAFFLLEPHPKMPDLGLSRSAADDLAAYIASQR